MTFSLIPYKSIIFYSSQVSYKKVCDNPCVITALSFSPFCALSNIKRLFFGSIDSSAFKSDCSWAYSRADEKGCGRNSRRIKRTGIKSILKTLILICQITYFIRQISLFSWRVSHFPLKFSDSNSKIFIFNLFLWSFDLPFFHFYLQVFRCFYLHCRGFD